MSTGIPYCDETWNVVGGCTRCSPACTNCWALRASHRLAKNPNEKIAAAYGGLTDENEGRPYWTGEVRCRPELLDKPFQWKRPRVIFVASMSDLFHEQVSFSFIAQVFDTMQRCRRHTFLVLTKRPLRMRIFRNWAAENVYMGVSVWDQESADYNLSLLMRTTAARRWVSLEPQLDPVDLSRYLGTQHEDAIGIPNTDESIPDSMGVPYHSPWVRGLDFVVQGCESGKDRRPFDPDWARTVRDQCNQQGVPYYLKQLPDERGKVIAAPMLDGRQWLETPWDEK